MRTPRTLILTTLGDSRAAMAGISGSAVETIAVVVAGAVCANAGADAPANASRLARARDE